jgi:lysophospholipase L1-like esterase
MIHDNLEFHNVTELVEVEGQEGLRLQRAPESVRAHVDEGTGGVMLSPAGCEIRFRIAEGCDCASVRLSSEDGATIYVYQGPFEGGSFVLGPEPIDIEVTPHNRIKALKKEDYPGALYNPGLIRLCFGTAYPEPVMYHGHSDGICEPRDEDVPKKTYLAYGSSITHGTALSGAALSYPAHAGWKLGYDVRNLGASGCCLCEKDFADFLAEQPCDLMTLELSVNMLGRGFTADEFRERAEYLVERVADSDPARPVVCITIFPHYHDISEAYYVPQVKATSEEYRQVIRDIVANLDRPNLSVIEGADLLKDLGGLTADLIHPGARGMIQIGEELAHVIKSRELV